MLTSSCPSLEGVGGAVTAALASDIEWETVAPNTSQCFPPLPVHTHTHTHTHTLHTAHTLSLHTA